MCRSECVCACVDMYMLARMTWGVKELGGVRERERERGRERERERERDEEKKVGFSPLRAAPGDLARP